MDIYKKEQKNKLAIATVIFVIVVSIICCFKYIKQTNQRKDIAKPFSSQQASDQPKNEGQKTNQRKNITESISGQPINESQKNELQDKINNINSIVGEIGSMNNSANNLEDVDLQNVYNE